MRDAIFEFYRTTKFKMNIWKYIYRKRGRIYDCHYDKPITKNILYQKKNERLLQHKLSPIFKEALLHYDDFHEIKITDHGWIRAKFSYLNKNVSFGLHEASKEEISNLGKKYSLVVWENELNSSGKIFRMVRGNSVEECLNAYFKLHQYYPRLITRKEFDSIELIEKTTFWTKDSQKNEYSAIKNNATIFVMYDHGMFEKIIFKKNQKFRIENDFIVFDPKKVIVKSY